ncbi:MULTISPECIES: sortase-dependent protein [unclassified Streptomyces]|uniref:sortase-dependent protein n=1 Tax=unclassified Streptomyces TaxID=2593676 RepID=UPI003448CCC4
MRRTVLAATALACTAVLGGTVPAFADGTTPRPVRTATPTPAPSEARSAEPTRASTPAPARDRGQVAAVPAGAPDTGVAEPSSDSGTENALIGGGAAAVLAAGAVLVTVRRRRATGA